MHMVWARWLAVLHMVEIGWWSAWLARGMALFWTGLAFLCLWDLVRVPKLSAVAPPAAAGSGRQGEPRVSVVIAARDEADNLPATLVALADQALREMEVIVVDDRSQDETWACIERWMARDARVRGVKVAALPPGWLGKNHALWQGALQAHGRWLVFLDADVRLHPQALAEAVAYAEREGLGHLTLAPRVPLSGGWLRALAALFVLTLVLFIRPQSAWRPRRRAYAGIGAFNMVRRDVYQRLGGHAAIRLRPDDDAALGKLLKRAGVRQRLLRAEDRAEVTWYPSLPAMVRGLEKSPLAAVGYRPWLLFLAMFVYLVLYDGPVVGCLTGGPAWPWWLYTVTLITVLYGLMRPVVPMPWLACLLWPGAVLLFAWTYARAAWLAYRRGGLIWRGTFYPLRELRGGETAFKRSVLHHPHGVE
ncbi:glycosyl transferase [Alicyclobacillus cellulosilyticus]|uniref:Glycosyl transferase n=2 Tax=Alicyclobacillus cellulosilyticus TaxID=1003997 RepID=A0A917NMZ4_9BACL|nr:glycosyl transferase [Alicyclobacillus cellulosilyticus]